jgi:Histidine kinase
MGFNSLVPCRPQYNATPSASVFAGMARDGRACAPFPNASVCGSTANLYARGEERLAERTRIAQELHDTLLQGFLAVSMQLHTAVDHLPADSAAKPRFRSVLQLLDRVLEQGRCAVQGLRSPNRDIVIYRRGLCRCSGRLGLPPSHRFSSGRTWQGEGIEGRSA